MQQRLRSEVRFDGAARAMYASDASHYRQVPIGVVVPENAEEVEIAIEICRQHDVPILMRGAGTSLAGQCCNVAVILDVSRHLNHIVEINPQRRTARVQPGVILDNLRSVAEKHGLTFGPDPSTHAYCTMGGMIGNNACGVHSVMAGRTSDNVEQLDILTYGGLHMKVGATSPDQLHQFIAKGDEPGKIYRALAGLRDKYAEFVRREYPQIPRRVSGFNLDELLPENGFNVARALVGSEGTCVTILEATVRLVPSPPVRTLVLAGYPTIGSAADDVMEVMRFGPTGLEGTADSLVENMRAKGLEAEGTRLLPPGRCWLLIEFGGDNREQANDRARALISELEGRAHPPAIRLIDDPIAARTVWGARESAVGASARLADGSDTQPGWEDAAVPPEQLGDYLHDFQKLLDQFHYRATIYGHFGQGCIHSRIDFDLKSENGIARYRSFIEQAADLVVRYGGSLSGEHGDGQSRAELLPKMYGPELLQAFREFKTIWDPKGKMNPGKVVDPFRLDENLRFGADYQLPRVDTHFQFPSDDGNFARATARCIGVGKCRREHTGLMCPSFMATHEEQHATRGRARLLTEMLEGNVERGWQDSHIKEALDLCLACKGCKRDCPAGVDLATYKAEFLAHHYTGRLRPRHAYAFGLIHWQARVAAMMPRFVNFLSQTRPIATLAKAIAGIAPQRQIPTFAPMTFKRWFARRNNPNPEAPPVLLWTDTFSNYFNPQIAQAAVVVLESAGFNVIVPKRHLCCGRPLYDFGMLSLAKRLLTKTLKNLEPHLSNGLPVVGLEPSCVAVFRDELINLLPNDPVARLLHENTHTLAEFLEKYAPEFQPPEMNRKALYHGHCHHKAIMGTSADVALLRRMGMDVDLPDTGCCGMAGSFGFEKKNYDISVQIGERVLLPAVENCDDQTLIISDGFSCREQVSQCTGRQAMHLAEVLQLALAESAPHGQ